MSASALPLTPEAPVSAEFEPPSDRIRLSTRMIFEGSPGSFLNLLVTGALLLIPTFGFYRFWLLTRVRRHLWANTRIGVEAFEYTGTGKELLIGFLIAVAVLVPIYVAFAILSVMAEEMRAFASVPLTLVLIGLGYFGAFRARRYRASRTLFRGLRFWMTGSGWGYAARAMGWGLLSAASLGLALPWASAALERYMMRRTRYGTLEGDFVGTARQLAAQSWYLWVLAVPVPISVLVGVVFAVREGDSAAMIAGGVTAAAVVLLVALVYPLLLATYARWHANGIRFGSVEVHSDLAKGAFLLIFVKLVVSIVALFIGFAWAGRIFVGAAHESLAAIARGEFTPGSIAALVTIALSYLVLLLGIGVLNRYFLARGLWAVLAASVTITDLAAIEEAVAAGEATSAVGEGLADALDFGSGF
jgi:uncharacterized membrane protein YjgN (DUF898 family)